MPITEEDNRPDLSIYHRPSKPVIERKDGYQHTPNVNTVPDWVLPVLVIIALGLFIIMVHAGTLKPLIYQ